MGCIVSKLFLDFYIFFIFTRPLYRFTNLQVNFYVSIRLCKAGASEPVYQSVARTVYVDERNYVTGGMTDT